MSRDLVIRGGDVVDGTGLSRRRADVEIRGGRVANVGHVTAKGVPEIDAGGCIVAPGIVVSSRPIVSPSTSIHRSPA